ncbi:MAG: DUF4349 domain-containing protein [Oscillospiraceae bacterium]|nr:DUF4349 domain-containing protein [Oscillospiraceae bacterium]
MKKNNRNFTKMTAIFFVCVALLTSCGASKTSEYIATNETKGIAGTRNIDSYKGDYASDEAYAGDSYDYGDYDYEYATEENGGTVYGEGTGDPTTEKVQNTDINTESINPEMLIYSCSMGIDVLDFEPSIDNFKAMLKQYQGFVESEDFNDGGNQSRWYDEKAEKWSTYRATVRVPSRVYDDFCNEVAELGDLRSKNASTENVSQEYSDLSTTLKIYEQKENRYLELLAKAQDEVNAVAIEEKLTGVQVEIAKLKTRMNQIKTDVAYSYVYVTINEVKEYQAEPVHTDTFGERLVNTLKDAGSGFLNFLEDLLFFLIYALPYLLLFGLGILIFVKIVKALAKAGKKRKEKKAAKKAAKLAETEPIVKPEETEKVSDDGEKKD